MVTALSAGLLAGIARIKVVLAFMALQNLALARDAKAFTYGLIRF